MSKKWPSTVDKEDQIVEFIRTYRDAHGRAPAYSEIAEKLNMTTQGVIYRVKSMISDGVLDNAVVKGYTIPRSLRVVGDE